VLINRRLSFEAILSGVGGGRLAALRLEGARSTDEKSRYMPEGQATARQSIVTIEEKGSSPGGPSGNVVGGEWTC